MRAVLALLAPRLGTALGSLLGAMVLLFLLTLLVPGNPAEVLLGPRATPEAVAAYARAMGLDQPVWRRGAIFLWRALRLDLGTDPVSGRPAAALVGEVLPPTLALTAAALLLALAAALPAGLLAARRPRGLADRLVLALAPVAASLPSFVVALLILLAGISLFGRVPVLGGGGLRHLVLPAVALALGWFGSIALLLRAALAEILAAPHIRTLRAQGMAESRLLAGPALRAAAAPVLAVLGVGVGQMLSGAVFVEAIFGRPGLGSLIVRAIAERDMPVVEAAVLVAVALFVAANLAVDLLLPLLDPRRRAP